MITGRFQEFVDNFSKDNQEGTLLDLSAVTVPIQMVAGTSDDLCPVEGVKRLQGELGDAVQLYTEVSDAEHTWFAS